MIAFFAFREISVGPIIFQVWGVMAAIGFLAALFISLSKANGEHIAEKVIWDVMILSLAGMMIGARLFYVISSGSFSGLFSLQGGFSLYGGLLLGGLFALLYLKRSRQDIGQIFDSLIPGLVMALIFVRIGCLMVSDHIGAPTVLPWAFIYEDGIPRHPVVLYEITFLSLLFRVLKKKPDGVSGEITLSFCAAYSAFRLVADFLRCSDLSFCDARIYGLTFSQWIAGAMLVTATSILAYIKAKSGSRSPVSTGFPKRTFIPYNEEKDI